MRSPFVFVLTPTVLALSLLCGAVPAGAQQVRLPLPKKSKYTPVQQLNRDGVAALKKHDIPKAKRLFYKAYLVDPNDPFTLNNLGYVAELEGSLDRAQRYYDQARANTSEAVVDKSTAEDMEGKTVAKVAGHTAEGPMKVNELNNEALGLLNRDRAPEADVVLQQALKISPNDPFTLNNMGFAKEKEGDLEAAIKFYDQAAATGSNEPIVIAFNKKWRGRPISEVAATNAAGSRRELGRAQDVQNQVARLNVQGVSAMNRNDRKAAQESFQKAYKLDPNNSFAINNMGYLAELEGDKETAQSYYVQAQRGERAQRKVNVSTRPELEGQTSTAVAEQSTALVETTFAVRAEARRQAGGAPALRTRDNRVVVEPKTNPNLTPPEFQRPPGDGTPQGNAIPNSAPSTAPTNATPQPNQPQPNQPQNQPELMTRPQQQQPQQAQPQSQQPQQQVPQQQPMQQQSQPQQQQLPPPQQQQQQPMQQPQQQSQPQQQVPQQQQSQPQQQQGQPQQQVPQQQQPHQQQPPNN
ncbi:MAG TPA: tetratricopeptide repeat protein [Candidatus Angelobacter sp.]|nr:tetratricopeptide repeat protein [Candidatus Angelobacter sp.]